MIKLIDWDDIKFALVMTVTVCLLGIVVGICFLLSMFLPAWASIVFLPPFVIFSIIIIFIVTDKITGRM